MILRDSDGTKLGAELHTIAKYNQICTITSRADNSEMDKKHPPILATRVTRGRVPAYRYGGREGGRKRRRWQKLVLDSGFAVQESNNSRGEMVQMREIRGIDRYLHSIRDDAHLRRLDEGQPRHGAATD